MVNSGTIAFPLTQQLKKYSFNWDPTADVAFECLKISMTTVLVLGFSDFDQPFVIEIDSLGVGVGGDIDAKGASDSTTHFLPCIDQSLFMNVNSWPLFSRYKNDNFTY